MDILGSRETQTHTPTRIQYIHAQWQLYISSLGVVYCERYVSSWTCCLGCVGACFTSTLWLCQKRPCGPSVEWELNWPMTNSSCHFISTNLFDRNVKYLIMHKSSDFWLQGMCCLFKQPLNEQLCKERYYWRSWSLNWLNFIWPENILKQICWSVCFWKWSCHLKSLNVEFILLRKVAGIKQFCLCLQQ